MADKVEQGSFQSFCSVFLRNLYMNHVSVSPIHQLLLNIVYLLRYGNDNIPI